MNDICRTSPSALRPPRAAYKLHKFIRRNRLGVITGALMTTTLLVATAVSLAFAVSETRQRRAADEARDQLSNVAEFQASQLSGVDPPKMGTQLRADLIERVRAAAERSGLSPDELHERVAEFEGLIAGSDFTGLALETLDENFFKPAVATIDKRFADQPLVKARLFQALADTQRKLGLVDQSVTAQTVALDIRRGVLGEDHVETLESIQGMARVLEAKGDLRKAEALYLERLDTSRRVFGDEHAATLDAVSDVGLILMARGELTRAESFLRQVLERRRSILGEDHGKTIASINNLGHLFQRQDKLADAEPLLVEAAEKYRRLYGSEDSNTLNSIANLGILLFQLGRFAEAEPYYREVLETSRRVLGNDHPDTIMSISNIGILHHQLGRSTETESAYREAMKRFHRAMGADHHNTLMITQNLGALYCGLGRFSDAESCLRRAADGLRRVLGDKHPSTLYALGNLASVLKSQGSLAHAERYARLALDGRRATLGDEHAETLGSIMNVGSILRLQDKPSEASEMLVPAEKAARRVFEGTNPIAFGRFLNELGRVRTDLKQFVAASENLTEARSVLVERTNPLNADLGDSLAALVELHDAWHAACPADGHSERAADWRREFDEWRSTTQPARHNPAVGN